MDAIREKCREAIARVLTQMAQRLHVEGTPESIRAKALTYEQDLFDKAGGDMEKYKQIANNLLTILTDSANEALRAQHQQRMLEQQQQMQQMQEVKPQQQQRPVPINVAVSAHPQQQVSAAIHQVRSNSVFAFPNDPPYQPQRQPQQQQQQPPQPQQVPLQPQQVSAVLNHVRSSNVFSFTSDSPPRPGKTLSSSTTTGATSVVSSLSSSLLSSSSPPPASSVKSPPVLRTLPYPTNFAETLSRLRADRVLTETMAKPQQRRAVRAKLRQIVRGSY